MPIELKCEMCGKALGEMNKGRVKNGSVLLCDECWSRAKIAVEMAESAMRSSVKNDVPDVVKDLFGHFRMKP